jgi:hypothetical protein
MRLSTSKCVGRIGVEEEVVAQVVSPRQCEFREMSEIRGVAIPRENEDARGRERRMAPREALGR